MADDEMIMHGNQPGVRRSQPVPGFVDPTESPAPVSAPAPSPKPAYAMEGFDSGKLGNAEHNTPKYQIARAIQNFDPKAGVTPEVLAALNALGIGTFEGQGDKVRVSGNMDPRFEGYTTIDLVRGFRGPGGGQAWQYGAENPDAPAAGASPSLNVRALQALMGGGGQATNPGQRLSDVQPVNELGAPTTFAPVQTDVDRASLDQLMGGASRRRG